MGYLLVCDLDGTLLNHNLEITPLTLHFLKEFIKDNYLLLNTGRSFVYSKSYLKDLDVLNNDHIFLSCNNGTEIYKYDELIKSSYLNTTKIINLLKKQKIDVLNLFGQISSNLQIIEIKEIKDNNINLFYDNAFNQINLITNTNQLNKTYSNYHFIYKGEFDNKHLYYIQNNKKDEAIKEVSKLLNIKDENIFVFGDDYNDLKMLKKYHNSYLMKNSKYKNTNFKQSLNDNEHDGVVKTIKKVLKV